MANEISSDVFTNGISFGDGDINARNSNMHVSDTQEMVSSTEATLVISDRGNDNHVLEIDQWVSNLERILEDVPNYMSNPGHPGRINRIPETLREVDVKAYEPHFMSIGPYHHGKSRVQQMEKKKLTALKSFLEQKPELTLADYLKEIQSIEPAVRRFYTDVKMDSESFVQMLLLDSLYIVFTFCGMAEGREMINHTSTQSRVNNEVTNETENQREGSRTGVDRENTQVMTRIDESTDEVNTGQNTAVNWFWPLLLHDLFLLENQLPFFVLQKMHALAYGGPETQIMDIIKIEVENMLSKYTKLDSETMIPPTEEVHHLLHLCHLFFRPTVQIKSTNCELSDSNQMFRLGSAIQLYEAGVRFEATSTSDQHSLLDITFGSSGKMVMPCLCVDDNTNSLLRNLVALEQMKYPRLGLHVSAYVVLLLHLVTVPDDVKLLRRKGIIQHHLSSDKEMMYLVNRLGVGLSFDYVEDEYSLKPVFQGLKRYSGRRIPRWRAWLKHRYCSIPWTMISLLAASLLLLSLLQTYCTVFSYYNRRFDGHS